MVNYMPHMSSIPLGGYPQGGKQDVQIFTRPGINGLDKNFTGALTEDLTTLGVTKNKVTSTTPLDYISKISAIASAILGALAVIAFVLLHSTGIGASLTGVAVVLAGLAYVVRGMKEEKANMQPQVQMAFSCAGHEIVTKAFRNAAIPDGGNFFKHQGMVSGAPSGADNYGYI